MATMATGLGKTPTFAAIAAEMGVGVDGGVGLTVAHLFELLEQAHSKYERAIPGVRQGYERSARRAPYDADIVLGMIQTMKPSRVREVLRRYEGRLRLVTIDEAHRSAANFYRKLIEVVLEHTDAHVLGLTATPDRTDKAGLFELYEEIVFTYDVRDGIQDGYLVPIRAYSVETDVTLDGIPMSHGDFSQSALGRRVNTPGRNRIVVDAYKQNAGGLKGIVFAASVAHAVALAEEFNRHGIRAVAVYGDMPKAERKARLEEYRRGKWQVLVGAQLFVEGFDVAGIEAVVLAAPTTSGIKFRQSVGRGLRPDELIAGELGPNTTRLQRLAKIARSNKPEVIVFDITDNHRRNNLITLPALFGAKPDKKKPIRFASGDNEQIDVIELQAQAAEERAILAAVQEAPTSEEDRVAYGETRINAVDLLQVRFQATDAIKDAGFRWVHPKPGLCRIELPPQWRALDGEDKPIAEFAKALAAARKRGEADPVDAAALDVDATRVEKVKVVVEVESFPGGWTIRACENGKWCDIGEPQPDVRPAIRVAEAWIRLHYIAAVAVVSRSAAWRWRKPSGAQKAEIERYGVPVPSTSGEASDLIKELRNRRLMPDARKSAGVR